MTKQKNIVSIALLAVVLIFSNIIFFITNGWSHFGALLPAYASLYMIYRYARLDPESFGAKKSNVIQGLKYGAIVCGIIFIVLLIAFAVNSHAFRDPRFNESLFNAFFSAIVLEPFKVILFEELAFRGMLIALLLRVCDKNWQAIALSSLAFGFWHILPSLHFGGTGSQTAAVVSSVLFTSLAGIFLAVLRLRCKSLAAPILVHWFVNAMAIILAAFSWR